MTSSKAPTQTSQVSDQTSGLSSSAAGLEQGTRHATAPGQGAQPGQESPQTGTRQVGLLEATLGAADGPAFARRVVPDYPYRARQRGQEGRVDLLVTIDAHGIPLDATVTASTDDIFKTPAVTAIKASRFHPARRDGRAVACRARLAIVFKLTE